MVKKIFFALGIVILIALIALFIMNRRPAQPIPDILTLPQKDNRPLSEIPETTGIPSLSVTSTQLGGLSDENIATSSSDSIRPIFDRPMGFLAVDYPDVYAFDFQEKSVKVFNVEEKTYRELLRDKNIRSILFSPSKGTVLVEKNINSRSRFFLIDLVQDTTASVDAFARSFVWDLKDTLWYHYSNNSSVNYIGTIQNKKSSRVISVGFPDPVFAPLRGNIFIANKTNSPLFFINVTTQKRRILVSQQSFFSLLANNTYVFASYGSENAKKSSIINAAGTIVKTFPWGTLSQKCTFDRMLVCGVSVDQLSVGSPEDWEMMKRPFFDKIVIYDIERDTAREIELPDRFDVVSPSITPLGIIFWNRIDAQAYLVPMK
ncbi:MAG: hypothetical protein UU76_C0003G0022 [Parcubacteria group bacterium GW2011_GWC1_41_7]|nr:MAG: hypothetical protein UU76_C0003G0022 [Parcubacteria group bacterium GW2011_GWC1_41_7]